MAYSMYEHVEIKEINGEIQVILHLPKPPQSFDMEFGLEFNLAELESLKKSAIRFVQKKFPLLKAASIAVVSGGIILTTFPLTAQAHEIDFNMSYLYFGNTNSYISGIDKTEGNLNVVSPSYFDINSDGSLKVTNQFDPVFISEMRKRNIRTVPFLSNHWDRSLGRAALANREKLSTQIADMVIKNNLDGVQVDIENVTDIDRAAYTDLVRLLRQKIPADKEVSVAVAANPNGWTKGWHGSYDYKELAKYSNHLMIMAYDESYTGGPEGPVASIGFVERSIQYALKQGVPSDKVVLGIPFYGRYWKEGAATGGDGISNRRVDELVAKYQGTVTFDEASKSPKATITIKPGDPTTTIAGKILTAGTYHIWYENGESLQAKLKLLHKYNLKGTGSWSLGQESLSMWQSYRSWLAHDTSKKFKTQTENIVPIAAETATPLTPASAPGTIRVMESETTPPGIATVAPALTRPIGVGTPGAISATEPEAIPLARIPIMAQGTVTAFPAPQPATQGTASQPPSLALNPGKREEALQIGSKGQAVTAMQTALAKIGVYRGPVDGVFGPATEKGVTAFQKELKLTADGRANSKTLQQLEVIATTLRVGSKGDLVTALENRLIRAGFLKGRALGLFENRVKNAVIAFQKHYKLKADGIAGPQTLMKIYSLFDYI